MRLEGSAEGWEWHLNAWVKERQPSSFGVGLLRGNNEHDMFKCRWYLSACFSFRFGSSSFHSLLSFQISPPMPVYTFRAALVTFPLPIPLPTPHNLHFFLQNISFYLRTITRVSVAEPIIMYVIPGVNWTVKLLEGWTNRLNMDGL